MRVPQVHAIGREILKPDFAANVLGAGTCNIDGSKMFICGHSLGGWTSMLATFGNQDVFKASLSFDPGWISHHDAVKANEYTCKWPVCSVMSS